MIRRTQQRDDALKNAKNIECFDNTFSIEQYSLISPTKVNFHSRSMTNAKTRKLNIEHPTNNKFNKIDNTMRVKEKQYKRDESTAMTPKRRQNYCCLSLCS
jgi:hypothetical protein